MNEYLGKNIRELRKSKNLTQEQFAESLGVSFQSVSRWENCVTYPDVEMLPVIARYFNVSTDYLFGIPEEEKKARFKALMSEVIDLPEDGSDRAIEIIRAVRNEYDARFAEENHTFGTLCGKLYCSDVKKTPGLKEELKKSADLFFANDPDVVAKSLAIGDYVCLMDEKDVPAFLDKYATDEDETRDAMLYERYLYLDQFDKVEIFRQKRLFKLLNELLDGSLPWKEWRAPNDVNFAFWKNNIFLDFLHALTNETPTADHPITCGLKPDVFASARIILGELRSCYLATLGRTDEALQTMEDTVSLIEQICTAPNGTILESRSPALPTLTVKIEKRGNNWKEAMLYYSADVAPGVREAWSVFPKVDYGRMMTDPGWAWFDPVRKDPRFIALAERVKKLI